MAQLATVRGTHAQQRLQLMPLLQLWQCRQGTKACRAAAAMVQGQLCAAVHRRYCTY